jgi:hypothetical protein
VKRAGAVALAACVLSCLSCSPSTEPDTIDSIEVSPFTVQLLVGPAGGQTTLLTAVAKRANGTVIDGVTFSWGTSTPNILSVDGTGLVTALAPGDGIVAATAGGDEGDAVIQVFSVPAVSYTISVDAVALEVSTLGAGTHLLAGVLRDSTGTAITDRQIFWNSTANGVATVSNVGLIRAIAAGNALIIGGREGHYDTVMVTVAESDTLADDADIQVMQAQWTQGVQLDDGSFPMIRGGRAAVVNVLLSANYSIATPSSVTLRIREPGGAIAHSQSKTFVVPTGVPATMATPHLQFLVPNHLLQPGRTWEIIRDPDGLLPDASAATDLLPRAGATAILIADVPPLRIRLVPVQLLSHGGAQPDLSEGQIEDYIRNLRQLHPHGEIEVTIGSAHATAQFFGTAPTGGGNAFWQGLLGELDVARVADAPNADAHWIGIVAPPGGFNIVTFGGYGFIPGNGASFGLNTRTSTLIRLGWFDREAQTRELVAHELGHNFGRLHSPCGGAGSPDPGYPRADGRIGAGAHNVFGWSEGTLTSAPAIGELVGDLMGYCPPPWISRHTYNAILNFRGFSAPVALRAIAVKSPPSGRTRVLLVRGVVGRGTTTLEPALTIDALPSVEDAAGAMVVEGLDAGGRVIISRRIAFGRFDHDDTQRPFAVAIPVDDAIEESVVELRVRHPGGEARRRAIAPAIRAPSADDAVTAERSASGVTVRCPAPAVAITLLDDRGNVRGMAPTDEIALRTAPGIGTRVVCSDGVRSRTLSIRR